jgi:hypothetical protein
LKAHLGLLDFRLVSLASRKASASVGTSPERGSGSSSVGAISTSASH